MQQPDVPYTPDYYRDVSGRSKVTRLLLLALIARALSQLDLSKLKANPGAEAHRVFSELNLIAWGVVWVTLIIASDYDATADLALAFSILVMVAVLLSGGERIMLNIRGLMNLEKIPTPRMTPTD